MIQESQAKFANKTVPQRARNHTKNSTKTVVKEDQEIKDGHVQLSTSMKNMHNYN
jgi:hypothetical protein